MKYLGIDYGEAHVGIAVGSDETALAVPLETIKNDGLDALCIRLARIAAAEGADALVIGTPKAGTVYLDQRQRMEQVVRCMAERLALPIHVADESFTTRHAQHLLRDASPAPGTDEHAIAAMLILQGFLDSKSSPQPPSLPAS